MENRLFRITWLLLDRGRMTSGELARELEVSVRTIYRDIDALSAAGVPIYATPGQGGGVELMESFVLDRAVFTEAEQTQLLTALQALPDSPDTRDMTAKLSGLFRRRRPDWLRVELSPWQSRDDGSGFEFFKNAILDRRILEFSYVSSHGVITHRRALPVRLVFKSRAWYLQGWSLERSAWRTFRLSRVLEPEDTGQVMDPPGPPPEVSVSFPAMSVSPVTLRFSPALAYRVYDEFEPADITREADGSLLVSVPFPIDSWLYGYLLSFGVGVEVLSPLYLKDQLALLGREIYRANAKPDSRCQLCSGILDPSFTEEVHSMENKEIRFCQSCGMPLSPEVLGTERDGGPSSDYCKYCYQAGAFTSSMTMEEMIDFCVPHMTAAHPEMTAEQAKAQMEQFFPMLLRWKK